MNDRWLKPSEVTEPGAYWVADVPFSEGDYSESGLNCRAGTWSQKRRGTVRAQKEPNCLMLNEAAWSALQEAA